jgi:tetratricopeptide (TPR) repeat protein
MKNKQIMPAKKESKFQQLITDQSQNPNLSSDISQDPDYQLMLSESQLGHWKECGRLITILEKRYPGNFTISEFKKDFELRDAIIKNMGSSAKEYNRKKFLRKLMNLLIIAGATIAALWIFLSVSNTYLKNIQQKQDAEKANQINELSLQVEILLNSEQPEKAQELVQKMIELDPASPTTIEFYQKTQALVNINNLYLDAVDKLKNGQDSDALSILTKIESEYPGYKDVPQLIESTTSEIKLAQALMAGTDAYNVGNWQEAIDNFEQVLKLDPGNSASNLKGMLVNSYLRRVIQMLENSNATISNINQAGIYYSQAMLLLPKSNVNLPEQEDLVKTSGSLVELNYTQAADQMIKDPAQTSDSVNQAFIFLEKASSLKPQDGSLKAEVNKMDLYRTGFRQYVDMNWQPAIKQLSKLTEIDENYANGFARQILYEAHIGQGNQYYSSGAFPDAESEYENAITLASGNKLNLYLAEIDLGRTQGKLNQYKDAATTFANAIESIDFEQRGIASPTTVSDLRNAVTLYNDGKYEESYNLFEKTLVGNGSFYEVKIINARQGNCLALISAYYQSSVQAILELNNLPQQTLVPSDQTLKIPLIP